MNKDGKYKHTMAGGRTMTIDVKQLAESIERESRDNKMHGWLSSGILIGTCSGQQLQLSITNDIDDLMDRENDEKIVTVK
jgi:hypothetical protein